VLEHILIIAWLMLAGVSNMTYFAAKIQDHNNSGSFYNEYLLFFFYTIALHYTLQFFVSHFISLESFLLSE